MQFYGQIFSRLETFAFLWFLPRPFPVRNGRGQHAGIRLRKVTSNGPIRAKYVNQSSAVIGQYA